MKICLKYLIFIVSLILANACTKETSIRARLFNPALNECVANATVVLVEKNGDGETASCKEIASGTTDANGAVYFDKKILRTSEGYKYYCAVRQSWGAQQGYTCAGKTSGFINVGKTQEIILTDYAQGYFKVQYNNLLNPSQLNDSLIVGICNVIFYDPIAEHNQGGGGVFGDFVFYGCNGFPFPPMVIITPTTDKIYGSRLIVNTRKRKMGTVTTQVDTVKAYPNQTTIIQVNW